MQNCTGKNILIILRKYGMLETFSPQQVRGGNSSTLPVSLLWSLGIKNYHFFKYVPILYYGNWLIRYGQRWDVLSKPKSARVTQH